jgi:hypothetical protein
VATGNQTYIPVHDSHAVKINQSTGQLRCPKANDFLREVTPSVEMVYHELATLRGGVKETLAYIEDRHLA